jgi:hypothetical protein
LKIIAAELLVDRRVGGGLALEAQMPETFDPILLDDTQAASSLNISIQDLDWLAATRQLLPVTICGKRRFLYDNLRDLARVYQSVQKRA